MGVQRLWEVLNKAGQSRALAHLAVVDGFEKNESGRRAYRVGIDASIWYQHADFSKGGENPELRLFFYRLRSLAELPLIPLFVFDGRERPKVKRGSKMGKSGSHNMTAGVKKLLDHFGMEWRMALGEAEAELAYLNRERVIDAILTDDVDTLIFGAQTIIRNSSLNLTGNRANPARNSEGKPSKHHVMMFSAETIQTHPDVRMSRGGLILFALLCGGDYDTAGIKGIGPQIAHALAQLGFGDRLLTAYERRHEESFPTFVVQWRTEINTELHTNSQKRLRSSYPSLSLPNNFPDMAVLENYADPVCSARVGRRGGGPLRDNGELSLPRLAGFCEDHFGEWGYRSAIIKRFRDLIWEAAVMRVLRRAALELDEQERTKRIEAGGTDTAIRGPLKPSRGDGLGTPSALVKKYLDTSEVDRRAAAFVRRDNPAPRAAIEPDPNPLIKKIVGSRRHVSTDHMLEYRVEVDPAQLVALAVSGIKGKHKEPVGNTRVSTHDDDLPEFLLGSSQDGSQSTAKGSKKPPPDPQSIMRVWLPASIMRQVHPGLVEDFEAAEEAKRMKKNAAGKRKRRSEEEKIERGTDSDTESSHVRPTKRKARKPVEHVVEPESLPNRDLGSEPNIASRNHTATPEISILAESSLPFRKCGFLFTFPDPDDPEQVFTEDADEGSVFSAGDVLGHHAEGESAPVEPPRARSAKSKGKTKVTARRPSAASALADDISVGNDDWEEEGPPDKYAVFMDRILGVIPGGIKGKKTSAKSKRQRASGSANHTEPSRASMKRRKTTHGGIETTRFSPLLPSNRSTSHPASNPTAWESDSLPARASTPLRDSSPLAAPFPLPSPLARPSRRISLRARETSDSDIIEVASDPEDVASSAKFATSRRRYLPIAEPSSSQDSALSLGGFLQDADIIIDLTR